MNPTLEERVAALEKKVALLASERAKPVQKEPFRSFGIFADDPAYESAMKFGREFRKQQTWEKEQQDQQNGDPRVAGS